MTTEPNVIDHASHHNGATVIVYGGRRIGVRTDAGLTVITIRGEIDASDVDDLSPHARGLVRDCGELIVDLSGIDFIGIDGLRALFALWSANPATTELPRERVMRIRSERMTVVLRHAG